jgi:tetratricopeptide (TPR) repeat protein
MTHYRAALQIRPDYAEAHANLGNVLQSQEKLDEAVAHYQQALALKPDYPKAYNNLGNALRSQGRSDEAATAYRQALALKPNYSEGYNNLANLLRDLANVEEARVEGGRALASKFSLPLWLGHIEAVCPRRPAARSPGGDRVGRDLPVDGRSDLPAFCLGQRL